MQFLGIGTHPHLWTKRVPWHRRERYPWRLAIRAFGCVGPSTCDQEHPCRFRTSTRVQQVAQSLACGVATLCRSASREAGRGSCHDRRGHGGDAPFSQATAKLAPRARIPRHGGGRGARLPASAETSPLGPPGWSRPELMLPASTRAGRVVVSRSGSDERCGP